MRLTKRGKLKRQKSLLIIGTFSLLLFLSVGYATFSTTITLNAKGKVHPTVTYTVDDLKSTVVTSGDGLYYDSNSGEYYYRGANPNNYIEFNNEVWRIMSISTSGNLKIIKDERIALTGYSGIKSGTTNQGRFDAYFIYEFFYICIIIFNSINLSDII
jgi:hypothetical protein